MQRDVDHEDRASSGPPATCTSSFEKSRRPDLELGLGAGARRARRRSARTPSPSRSPTTTAAAGALVHDRAHERARRQVDRGVARRRPARRSSSAGIDSPVRTASSHSSRVASSSRTSAGTTSPTRSATTSPGTRSRTSTRRSAPSRRSPAPRGGCWRAAPRRRSSERYSLTKPSPTLSTTIAAMIAAVGRVTGQARRRPPRPASRISSGLRSCRISTPSAVTRCVRSTFGPNVRSRSSACDRPAPMRPRPGDSARPRRASAPHQRDQAIPSPRSAGPPQPQGPEHIQARFLQISRRGLRAIQPGAMLEHIPAATAQLTTARRRRILFDRRVGPSSKAPGSLGAERRSRCATWQRPPSRSRVADDTATSRRNRGRLQPW